MRLPISRAAKTVAALACPNPFIFVSSFRRVIPAKRLYKPPSAVISLAISIADFSAVPVRNKMAISSASVKTAAPLAAIFSRGLSLSGISLMLLMCNQHTPNFARINCVRVSGKPTTLL